jgi:hypothetical protein
MVYGTILNYQFIQVHIIAFSLPQLALLQLSLIIINLMLKNWGEPTHPS